MNEKDLKKLNRLELLQILLEESKENEKLREEIEQTRQKYSLRSQESRAIDALTERIKSLEGSVGDIKQIASQCAVSLPQVSVQIDRPLNTVVQPAETEKINDKDMDLLEEILNFFRMHSYLLGILPKDIQNKITERINGA